MDAVPAVVPLPTNRMESVLRSRRACVEETVPILDHVVPFVEYCHVPVPAEAAMAIPDDAPASSSEILAAAKDDTVIAADV